MGVISTDGESMLGKEAAASECLCVRAGVLSSGGDEKSADCFTYRVWGRLGGVGKREMRRRVKGESGPYDLATFPPSLVKRCCERSSRSHFKQN